MAMGSRCRCRRPDGRYFEAFGEVRRAFSVVKKRSGGHEHAIREFQLAKGGLIVGPPIKDFRGIFTGTPTYVGELQPLMPDPDNGSDS
jgi:circadian clock protein KaiC